MIVGKLRRSAALDQMSRCNRVEGDTVWIGKHGILLIMALVAVAAMAAWRLGPSRATALVVEITPSHLTADGYSSATLHSNVPAAFSIASGQHAARIEGSRIVAGVLGGPVVVEARAAGFRPVRAAIDTVAQSPEQFLPLDDESDRAAFLRWFTWLAESQYFAPVLPPEINDCAALLRFAYRETLREHDGRWAGDLNLVAVPPMPAVRKYVYPYTPLGAALFRTRDGYAEFANAQTLIRYNAHLVGRDLRVASPGDLLFYRQLERDQPFHTMIFLGDFVVYHTGPFHGGPGEIRRPSVVELLHHPAPLWRPETGNPNFLGVYRWNILRR
jgi:uncharacterized protein YfaT (DUF1175 family)